MALLFRNASEWSLQLSILSISASGSASWCAQAAKYRTVAQAAYADIAVPCNLKFTHNSHGMADQWQLQGNIMSKTSTHQVNEQPQWISWIQLKSIEYFKKNYGSMLGLALSHPARDLSISHVEYSKSM